MPNSNYLDIVPLTTGQTNKEASINTGWSAFEQACNQLCDVDLTSASHTLSVTEFTRNILFDCHGHSVARNLVTPDHVNIGNPINRLFVVKNRGTSSGAVTVKNAAGTTIVVPIGAAALLFNDGTNITAVLYDLSAAVFPFDVPAEWRGVLTNSCVIRQFIAVRAFEFAAVNLVGSEAAVTVNPTATMTITFNKNGSPFATLAYSTSGVPTFTMASPTSFAIGDTFSAVGQASADATGAGAYFTLLGVRL